MICTKCKSENLKSANFCNKCGYYFDKNALKTDYNKDTLFVLYFFIFQLIYLIFINLIDKYDDLISVTFTEFAFAIIILCFAGIDYTNFKSSIRPKKLKLKPLIFILFSYPIFGVLVHYFSTFLNRYLLKSNFDSSTIIFNDSVSPLLISIIFVSIFPAIFEELAFRGFVFNRLFRITKLKTTILISSILFTLLHLSIFSTLWIFPLGITFGYLRAKYRTIWYGVIAHFIYNSTIVLIDYLNL
jgi:membrane protease YdiL (CAAX protease family)